MAGTGGKRVGSGRKPGYVAKEAEIANEEYVRAVLGYEKVCVIPYSSISWIRVARDTQYPGRSSICT
jgi:hypothetical protein